MSMDITMMRKDIITELPEEPADDPWAWLPPPPRSVPLAARWRLMNRGSPPLSFGLIWLTISSLIAIPMGSLADPMGDWRLARGTRTAPGRVERVVGANLKINDRPVFRHEYTVRLPGGTTLRGASFAQGRLAEGRRVVVEYWPRDPRVSRIRGMRSGALPSPWLLMLGLFPLIGLALVAVGTREGRKRVRILVHGLPALATIEAARLPASGESEPGPYQPFAEFQRSLEARPSVAQRPTMGLFGCLWNGIGIAILIAVVVVCGALLGMSLAGLIPMRLAGRPVGRGMAALFIVSCGLAAVALCVMMIVQGGGWHSAALARDERLAVPATRFPLDCRLVFRTADGETVQADDHAVFQVEPGHRVEAEQRVLYDPDRPTRAMLVAGLDGWPFDQ